MDENVCQFLNTVSGTQDFSHFINVGPGNVFFKQLGPDQETYIIPIYKGPGTRLLTEDVSSDREVKIPLSHRTST